jgi:hypothetical protein
MYKNRVFGEKKYGPGGEGGFGAYPSLTVK